jgi:hypothetical protein
MKWFGEKYFRHGFNRESPNYRTTPYKTNPGICIGGHFNRLNGEGVKDLYPGVDQSITFLRDPFEIALSNYFFWKGKRREILIRQGLMKEGGKDDFKNINDYFLKRKVSFILDFMPVPVTLDNYQETLENYFVHVGIVEDLQASADILADKLEFSREKVQCLNKFERDETVSREVKEEYMYNNRLQYHFYNYVRCRYNQLRGDK